MAEIKYCGQYEGPVNDGEERLQKFLEINLPDEYIILPGIELASVNPRNNQVQYLEYDCIVVTPHAIYNIENKDYSGRLEGDDDYWYHREKEMRNPHKTLRFKTGVLASKLKDKNRDWGKAWIQSIVTLSNPHQLLQGLYGSHVKATFLLNEKLIEYICDPYGVSKTANDIVKFYKPISEEICGTASRKSTNRKKEVEGHEIVEILDQEKNYTEYLARPKGVTSGVKKRIKEYALDVPNLNSDQRTKRELQIQNAYKALRRIKSNPFILNVQFNIDEEGHKFYEITDFLDENTLRAEMKRRTFTMEDKLRIVSNLISALKAAHEADVYHRDLNPENVYLTGGYACLGNFGKAFFTDHLEEGFTVMATITEQTATAYHPLELLQKDASRSSDIYSLGILSYELFVGKTPFSNPFELNNFGGKLPPEKLPTSVNPALPKWLDEFCLHCIRTSPEDRWDNMDEMETFLQKSTERNEEPKENKKTEIESIFNFEVGSRIADYTIYGHIGSGGYSQVYKVKHNLRSNTVYALKAFNESVHASTVIDEYDALKELKHPNIVQFVWNGTLSNGQFYTLMEYLEGENLKDYAKGDKRLPIYRIYQVAKDILSALVEMQSKETPIFHRDIKPHNIVWDKGSRFVLIDFNVASSVLDNREHVGTHPYLAPDLIAENSKVNWDKSADPFALGITLYELACKAYPWSGSLKMPIVDKEPTSPKTHNPKLSQAFADFIFKALATRKNNRFADASEMYNALLQIGENNLLEAEKETSTESVEAIQDLDFVAYVNSLFSQSRHGNAGTRSGNANSVFDNLTYTPTKLDDKLIPDILDGRYRLVIITGNAGDGKTALIRKIEERSNSRKSLDHGNGATFNIHGMTYQSNYDGSQDEDERGNSLVLNDFFKPFENLTDYSKSQEGRIIAINEGRLVEFLKTSEKFNDLANTIEEYFYQEAELQLPKGLLIVNLNLRSVVASNDNEGSLFRRQLKQITQKQLWKKCDGCPAASKCFIRYNVETLNDTSAGDEIITRLEWLLRTVALKREVHITMRDLRSLISYLITRDYHCSEIEELNSNLELIERWKLYYFNITDTSAIDYCKQDRLVKLLGETDLADVAIPRLDRDLFFGIHKPEKYLDFSERNHSLFEEFNSQKIWIPAHENSDEIKIRTLILHKLFIRHQYFEGKIDYKNRLPYRSASSFIEILKSSGTDKQKVFSSTIQSISKAVSLNEGCNKEEIYSKYLVLSSSHVEDPSGKTYRLFPLSDFELLVSKVDHLVNYLEYEPDSLLFRNKVEKSINLTISLDLFEMLDFISKGYSPSLNDLKGRFIELHIFKNLLENKEYKEVVVTTRDNRDFYVIRMNSKYKIEVAPFSLENHEA
jgi:serine/threonine protein kinase